MPSEPGHSIVDLLHASELLRTIPTSDLEELAACVHRSSYATHELIFRKQDEGTGMMIVVSGRVKIVSVSPSGSEVLINLIDPRQVFGEMALIDGKPRSADAVAAQPTELLTVYRNDFLPVLERNPKAAVAMMEILCGRIRQTTSFVEDAVLMDSRSRLVRRLKALAAQYGRPDGKDGAIRIDHGLSQQEIGDSVGLTRVSINKLLGMWRSEGLIRDGRGYIVMNDPARFDALLEEP